MTGKSAFAFGLLLFGLVFLAGCRGDSSSDDQRRPVVPATDDDDDDAHSAVTPDDHDDDEESPEPTPEECPFADMLYIPAGEFLFRYEGDRFAAEGLEDELVYLEAFCIDRYEYPNRYQQYPASLNWYQAEEACAVDGKRLCTWQEWQKACTGPDSNIYPWGDDFEDNLCNTHTADLVARELAPSGDWPYCSSDYGVMDIAGNVSEWVADLWQEGWSDRSIAGGGYNINPNNSQELQEDGFWRFTSYSQRCSSVHHHPPEVGPEDDGARCCTDLNND